MSSMRAENRRARKAIAKEQKRAAKARAKADSCQREQPVLDGVNAHYGLGHRTRAIAMGGIGAMDILVQHLGLPGRLNKELGVLKRHIPYHDSDHILTLVYNILCGGSSLEDVERLRTDATVLAALGARRLPDPTTLGDFLRRFDSGKTMMLQDIINDCRVQVWQRQPSSFLEEATIDVDGTLVPTGGNCKQGVGMSYKGEIGYHPLLVSLAQTQEPLFLVNRSGNANSCQGAGGWIDTAIGLVERAGFRRISLRGDTAFSQLDRLDGWHGKGIRFVLGLRVMEALEQRLEALDSGSWKELVRPPKYEIKGEPRTRPENVRASIISEKEYLNLTLELEEVAELQYVPTGCKNSYRLVAVRKTIRRERGQLLLTPEVRYFVYLTNDQSSSPEDIVFEANRRCTQEKLIDQLKNQANAMRMPVDTLTGNWAYMVIGGLAVSLKVWFALMLPTAGRWEKTRRHEQDEVLKMDFRRFLQTFINLPAQIVRGARRVYFRLLNHNRYTHILLNFLQEMMVPSRC